MLSDDVAVRARSLRKIYEIYQKPHDRFLQTLFRGRRRFYQEFCALDDVSFEVARGETLGILGRNGSGKSTLLQLIAGTVVPTSGSSEVRGRVSAILELGAGFNPEFTGRENIEIATAVLGMTSAETRARMGDIVGFADIGEHIDQPVKTYSSGMYARLAFAVAVHVDPDVLIVDEALAVGDAKFQAQCFRKFEDFRRRGVSILFVTHSVDQIVRHCSRALLLDRGRLVMSGEPKAVVARYLEFLFGTDKREEPQPLRSDSAEQDVSRLFAQHAQHEESFERRGSYNKLEHRWGNRQARLVDYLLLDGHGLETAVLRTGEHAALILKIVFDTAVERPILGITIKTPDGVEISGSNSRDTTGVPEYVAREAGEVVYARFDFDCVLNAGEYLVSVGVAADISGDIVPLDRRYDAIHLHVMNARPSYGLVDLGFVCEQTGERRGIEMLDVPSARPATTRDVLHS